VPGHFHLIFAGTVVTMYFAVAYNIWPELCGKTLISEDLALVQLWSWFVGMGILTTPWHVLGLLGQPRRISSVNYNSVLTLAWDPYELAMIIGGLVLLASACLFLYCLYKTQVEGTALQIQPEDDPPSQPAGPLPDWLNDFKLWNLLILGLMVLSFGYPILQFFFMKTYDQTAWGY